MPGRIPTAWPEDDRALVAGLCAYHQQLLRSAEALLWWLWRSGHPPGGTARLGGYSLAAGPQLLPAPERAALITQLGADLRTLQQLTADLQQLQALVHARP